MKKRDTLPDFTELYPPEQHPIYTCITELIFLFFAAAIGGFLWEVLIFVLKEDTFRNRGFLYGPWLPVYGIGAVLFYVLLKPRSRVKNRTTQRRKIVWLEFLRIFLLSLLIGSALEYAIGWFLYHVWGLRYWDYRGYPLQLDGYVCLLSALGFGIAGVLWVGILSRFLLKIWYHVSAKIRRALLTILVLTFLADCVAALIFPNAGRGITF